MALLTKRAQASAKWNTSKLSFLKVHHLPELVILPFIGNDLLLLLQLTRIAVFAWRASSGQRGAY
jgi:hypothetical protein